MTVDGIEQMEQIEPLTHTSIKRIMTGEGIAAQVHIPLSDT